MDSDYTMPKNSFFNSWRPDRIILKSQFWDISQCFCVGRFCVDKFFGQDFLEIERDNLVRTPSDHFGIIGSVFFNKEKFFENEKISMESKCNIY